MILPEQPSISSQEDDLDSGRPENAPLLDLPSKTQRKQSEKLQQPKKPDSRQKPESRQKPQRREKQEQKQKPKSREKPKQREKSKEASERNEIKSPLINQDVGQTEQEKEDSSPEQESLREQTPPPELETPLVGTEKQKVEEPKAKQSQKEQSKKEGKPKEKKENKKQPKAKKEGKREKKQKEPRKEMPKKEINPEVIPIPDEQKPQQREQKEESEKNFKEQPKEEEQQSEEEEQQENSVKSQSPEEYKAEDSIEEVQDENEPSEGGSEQEEKESEEPEVLGVAQPKSTKEGSVAKSEKKPQSMKKPKEEKKKKEDKKQTPQEEKKAAPKEERKNQANKPQNRKPSPQKVASRDPSLKKQPVPKQPNSRQQSVKKQPPSKQESSREPSLKRDISQKQNSRQPSVNKSVDQNRSLRKEVSPSVKDITPSLRSKASEPKQRPRDPSINKSLRSGAQSSDQPVLSKVPSRRAEAPLKQRGTTNPSQKKSSVAPSADQSSIMSKPGRNQTSLVTPSSMRPMKNVKSRSNIKPISSKKFESDQSREESIAQSSQKFGSRNLAAIPDFKKRDPSVKKLNNDSVEESDEAEYIEQLSELEEELKDPGPLKWNSEKTQASKKERGPDKKKSSIPEDIFQQASKMFPEEEAQGEQAAPSPIQTVSPRPLEKAEKKKRSPRQAKETKKGVKVLFSDHSTTSVDTNMDINPTQFYHQNDWQKQRRLAKGNTQSVQLNMRRVGGIPTSQDFNTMTPTPANAGQYPTVGYPLSHLPMSARPNIGASSVSPVLQKGGTLALGGDPRAFNNLLKESRERDAADMIGGFGTLDPLKQAPVWGGQDNKPEEEFKNFGSRNIDFFPNTNRSIDHSNEEMLSNGPLSGRNQAIQLNPGYHPSSLTPHSGQNTPFAFAQQAPVYLGGGQPTGYSKRSQLKRTGFNDVSPFQDDMLERAYNNPTSFERNVIQGRIRDDLFDDSVTYVNRGQGLQEVHSSAKRKQNRASKVNLHAERGDIPPGAMKPVLKAKIRDLESAYMQNKTVKKDKSKGNLKLNNMNLMHVMPPQGDPPMSRMSPIPPNHRNYAFSPRK